jgi:hypothetical protein
MSKIVSWWQTEPAALLYAISAGLAPLVAMLLHWSQTQTAAEATIVSGVAAIVVALKARPVAVPAILGAAATIATASAAFGLHLTADQIAAGTSAMNLVLGFLFRSHLTPVASLQNGVPAG